jgi:hypothetical protein
MKIGADVTFGSGAGIASVSSSGGLQNLPEGAG